MILTEEQMEQFENDLQAEEYVLPQHITDIESIIEWCKGNLDGKEAINR